MTLRDWAKVHKVPIKPHRTGAFAVPIPAGHPIHSQIYRLDDYAVSSVVAGTTWVVPKSRPHPDDKPTGPVLHLTFTGYDAGKPICGVDKQAAIASGCEFLHAQYLDSAGRYSLPLCPDCKRHMDEIDEEA